MNDEQLIWDYLDDALSLQDQKRFEERLQSDESFRAAFDEHQLIHVLLKEQMVEQPSIDFTQKVMERVKKDTPPAFSLNNILLLLFGFILINVIFLLTGNITMDSTYELINEVGGVFSNNYVQVIGMMLVGISGLILLDQILSKRVNLKNRFA